MISERMMGMGKLHSREYRLMSTVLRIMRLQVGALKNRWNHFRPTHVLPVKPLLGVKSRKAIWMPYMGMYLYMMVRTTGISRSAYICQLSRILRPRDLECSLAAAAPP